MQADNFVNEFRCQENPYAIFMFTLERDRLINIVPWLQVRFLATGKHVDGGAGTGSTNRMPELGRMAKGGRPMSWGIQRIGSLREVRTFCDVESRLFRCT